MPQESRNWKVRYLFEGMVRSWFNKCAGRYNSVRKKESLEECVRSALAQIEEKHYETTLLKKGIPAERIRKYGFAFEGSHVLIGEG